MKSSVKYDTKAETSPKVSPFKQAASAVLFPQKNHTLTRPPGWTEEQCADLHCFRAVSSDGVPVTVSCWRFPFWTRLRMLITGKVWVYVLQPSHPPIALLSDLEWKRIPGKDGKEGWTF